MTPTAQETSRPTASGYARLQDGRIMPIPAGSRRPLRVGDTYIYEDESEASRASQERLPRQPSVRQNTPVSQYETASSSATQPRPYTSTLQVGSEGLPESPLQSLTSFRTPVDLRNAAGGFPTRPFVAEIAMPRTRQKEGKVKHPARAASRSERMKKKLSTIGKSLSCGS